MTICGGGKKICAYGNILEYKRFENLRDIEKKNPGVKIREGNKLFHEMSGIKKRKNHKEAIINYTNPSIHIYFTNPEYKKVFLIEFIPMQIAYENKKLIDVESTKIF